MVIGSPSGMDTTMRTTIMLMKLVIFVKKSPASAVLKTQVSRDSLIMRITRMAMAEQMAPRVNYFSKF